MYMYVNTAVTRSFVRLPLRDSSSLAVPNIPLLPTSAAGDLSSIAGLKVELSDRVRYSPAPSSARAFPCSTNLRLVHISVSSKSSMARPPTVRWSPRNQAPPAAAKCTIGI